jgi:regulatory protein
MATNRAWTIALRALAGRSLSERELAERLRRHGFSADTTATLIDRLREMGLLDDRRLALQLIERDLAGRRAGPGKIRGRLRRRGITEAVIAEVWEQAAADVDWMAIAEALFPQYDREESGTVRERARILRRLARDGFPRAVLARLAEQWGIAEAGAAMRPSGDGYAVLPRAGARAAAAAGSDPGGQSRRAGRTHLFNED